MGLTEFGLLTSSGAMGSLLVYGYQKWLKKKTSRKRGLLLFTNCR
jgi:hypothetical protein